MRVAPGRARSSDDRGLPIGYAPGGAMTMPRPMREGEQVAHRDRPRRRARCRRAAGRASPAPAGRRAPGSSRSTGSSSRSVHSSTRIIAATAVTGFVIDAMRKIESRRTCAAFAAHGRSSPMRVDVHLAAAADERDDAGHVAALDVSARALRASGRVATFESPALLTGRPPSRSRTRVRLARRAQNSSAVRSSARPRPRAARGRPRLRPAWWRATSGRCRRTS